MDLSPDYVQMCRQAKEIQGQWKPQDGDYIFIPKGIKYEEINDYGGGVQENDVLCVFRHDSGRNYTFHASRESYLECGSVFSENPYGRRYNLSDVIKLHRQDQLQAMVFNKTALSLACCFKDYIVRPMFDERMSNRKEQMVFMMKASMEQLWLCFTMHTLYKLRWNGSDWVAE